ncbi:hypothetical protein [Acinetobacter colistiniresistens]|uniref:hypothetical protein n=1 Tax=Acinetobacter colistiniresistens TaxID=280145 RepID=UPI001250AE03|nr:hypothetical protein [Acinetobacter colistiniresistens]
MSPLERIKLANELKRLCLSIKNNAVTGFELVKAKNRAEEISYLLSGPNYKIFPLDAVENGYEHSTRNPYMIAVGMRNQYYETITKAIAKGQAEVKTTEQQQALDKATIELQDLYISKIKALAASRSGVMSSFIAGRSNFNSKQANRRGNAYDRVALDFENWVENVAPDYIWLAVRQAMTNEQRQVEIDERQLSIETKRKAKLDKDSEALWRILEPKAFPMDYSKDMLITRVSFSKDKLPSSITIAMKDGSFLIDNKIVLNKVFKNLPEVLGHLEQQGKNIPKSWSEINTGT